MVLGSWSFVPGPSFVLSSWCAWCALRTRHGLRTKYGPSTLDGPRTKKQEPGTSESGYTFIELLVVATIILILASAIMPLARVTATRQREMELRRALREMRTAIDKYNDAAVAMQIGALDLKPDAEGYPPDLETLVEGVTAANDQTGRKLKFLRRVPIDPMTHTDDWGMRSYQDAADATRWGGQNVFDVYTKYDGTALDGTKYKDW
jgi:general secretion pathway protein G